MVRFNVDSLDFQDEEETRFGTGDEFAARFDSSNNRFELEDLTNGTVANVPRGASTDLVGGKYAQTVDEGKALADDGNTYQSVQTAINNANSYVKIGPGLFEERIDFVPNGFSIVGSGNQTVLTNASGTTFEFNSSNIYIANFKIANCPTAFNTLGDRHLIENLTMENFEGNALSLSASETKITNCILDSVTGGDGFYTRDKKFIIVNNHIKNVDEAGISTRANAADNIIANNTITNCGTGISLTFDSADDVVVYGNRIDNMTVDGINISNNVRDCIIVNNRISRSGGFAIDTGGTGNLVQDNQVI